MPTSTVRSHSRNLRSLILLADPDFNKDRRKTPAYEFSNGRKFYQDPENQGIYSYQLLAGADGALGTEDDEYLEV